MQTYIHTYPHTFRAFSMPFLDVLQILTPVLRGPLSSLSLYIYICMYVCIYIYTHTYIYTHMQTYIHTYTHTYIQSILHAVLGCAADPHPRVAWASLFALAELLTSYGPELQVRMHMCFVRTCMLRVYCLHFLQSQ